MARPKKNKTDNLGRKLLENEVQLPSGEYRFRYPTDDPKKPIERTSWRLLPDDPMPSGHKSKKPSLREQERQLLKDIDDKLDIRNANMRVKALVSEYIEYMSSTWKKTTLANRKALYEKHIKESSFGNLKISDVKTSQVQWFYRGLRKDSGLEAGSCQIIHGILNGAFERAVNDDLIRKNPCKGAFKSIGEVAKPREAIEEWQANELIRFAYELNTPYADLLYVINFTGLRAAEIFGLTWDDVDFKSGIINVRKNLNYDNVNGKYQFFVSTPKTSKSIRQVAMMGRVKEILKGLYQKGGCSPTVDGYSNFIFLNQRGGVYNKSMMDKNIKKLVLRYDSVYGTEFSKLDISLHTFRHNFCCYLFEQGFDVKDVQYAMGHEKYGTTMNTYNMYRGKAKDDLMDRMQAIVVNI